MINALRRVPAPWVARCRGLTVAKLDSIAIDLAHLAGALTNSPRFRGSRPRRRSAPCFHPRGHPRAPACRSARRASGSSWQDPTEIDPNKAAWSHRHPVRLFFKHRSGLSRRRCRSQRSNHPLRAAKILAEGALGAAPGFGSDGAAAAPAPAEPGRQEPGPGEGGRATVFGERMECDRGRCAETASANQDPSLSPRNWRGGRCGAGSGRCVRPLPGWRGSVGRAVPEAGGGQRGSGGRRSHHGRAASS